LTAEPLRKRAKNSSNGSSSVREVAKWRAVKSTTAKSSREVSKMTVFVLVDNTDGFVYGVFTDEEKAYDEGNALHRPGCWDVYEREVQ
jgi:hypothetical protein